MTSEREIILHIGMPKTGTTSIQRSLASFDDGNCRYVRLDRPNHSLSFHAMFSQANRIPRVYENRGWDKASLSHYGRRLRKRLDEELSKPRSRMIISGEGITRLTYHALEDMKDCLSAHFGQIRVLTYIREPVGLASSTFQQQVKGGSPVIKIPLPRYRSSFKKFQDIFGRGQVQFVKFDPKTFPKGSVVQDFWQRVGLPGDSAEEARQNMSLSMAATKLLCLFNREGVKSTGSGALVRQRTEMIRVLRAAFPGSAFQIPRPYVLTALDRADVSWMESQTGFALLEEPIVTDVEQSHTEFKNFIDRVDPKTTVQLRDAMNDRGIPVESSDNNIELLNRLFLSFTEETPRVLFSRALRRLWPTR